MDSPLPANQPVAARIGLVIPCFRESRRLPGFLEPLLECCAGRPELAGLVVQVVDDGSGMDEADRIGALVEAARARYPVMLRPLVRLPSNVGKGATVYAGWDGLAAECTRLAFVDADGAVPAAETARFLALAAGLPPDTALFASRLDPRLVRRSLTRRVVGGVFRLLVRLLVRLPVRDTQCGLKVIPAAAYRAVRTDLTRPDFVFDIDLALALHARGWRLREECVRWQEQPGSHLRSGHAMRMLAALFALRSRRRGQPCTP